MKDHSKKISPLVPLKTIGVITVVLLVTAFMTSGFKGEKNFNGYRTNYLSTNNDSIESVAAFMQVYKVLMSPRCMNCHPSGDRPLQGDDSHVHTMNVQRGKDGKGLYALKCSNCHQPENAAVMHAPPGNPKWQLPPADMKMVFQGRSAHNLALQIMDYNRNGHKDKAMLLEHARDTLVKIGWHMGEGRTPPPMAYNDFVAVWDTWINKGGYAPPK
jgi:mono/diheme cytochrome c family protein